MDAVLAKAEPQKNEFGAAASLALMVNGDVSRLSADQKKAYLDLLCQHHGFDAVTRPFQLIKTQMGEAFYLTKGAVDQLIHRHGISVEILSSGVETIWIEEPRGDNAGRCIKNYVVKIRAHRKDGTYVDDQAAVALGNNPADMANMYMKATTKGRRRAGAIAAGLNMMVEDELDTVPHTKVA